MAKSGPLRYICQYMANPRIYDYLDYREYLLAVIASQGSRRNGFTLRAISRRAAIHSTGFLSSVLKGARKLTDPVAGKLATALNLKEKERDYFLCLVRYADGRTTAEREQAFEGLSSFRVSGRLKTIGADQYEFYRHWRHAAIRELVTIPGFKANPIWIARQLNPKVTPAEVRSSLTLLTKLGMIKKEANGRYRQTDSLLWDEASPESPAIRTLRVRGFHRQMIGLAMESLNRFKTEDREVGGLTLAVSDSAAKVIRKRMNEFQKEIMEITGNDRAPASRIYQTNLQFFPLSNRTKLTNGDNA